MTSLMKSFETMKRKSYSIGSARTVRKTWHSTNWSNFLNSQKPWKAFVDCDFIRIHYRSLSLFSVSVLLLVVGTRLVGVLWSWLVFGWLVGSSNNHETIVFQLSPLVLVELSSLLT